MKEAATYRTRLKTERKPAVGLKRGSLVTSLMGDGSGLGRPIDFALGTKVVELHETRHATFRSFEISSTIYWNLR